MKEQYNPMNKTLSLKKGEVAYDLPDYLEKVMLDPVTCYVCGKEIAVQPMGNGLTKLPEYLIAIPKGRKSGPVLCGQDCFEKLKRRWKKRFLVAHSSGPFVILDTREDR